MTPITELPSEWLVNGWTVAGAVVGERGAAACQDRAVLVPIDGGVVVAVADGAGGRAGGAEAATAVIGAVAAASTRGDPWRGDYWVEVLRQVDAEVAAARHGGESTAVVLALGEHIVGASVGDSAAWILGSSGIVDLTGSQHRRPMIGSGCAAVASFAGEVNAGTVLVASDGFAKYAPRARVASAPAGVDLAGAVSGLIDMVRLRSGALQDDVAVVLCRAAEPGRRGPVNSP